MKKGRDEAREKPANAAFLHYLHHAAPERHHTHERNRQRNGGTCTLHDSNRKRLDVPAYQSKNERNRTNYAKYRFYHYKQPLYLEEFEKIVNIRKLSLTIRENYDIMSSQTNIFQEELR